MSKLKNYGLWVAIASFALMFLQDLGVITEPERYQTYIDSVLSVLILLGIISNPKEGKWFADTKGVK